MELTNEGGILLATIRVCDAPMGIGKTSAAINEMNVSRDTRYLFVTPFLSEVDRVVSACASRSFVEPESRGAGKLATLEDQLIHGRCVACTHKLFSMYTQRTEGIIRRKGYTLILDEAFDVMSEIKIKNIDYEMLINNGIIKVTDDGRQLECLCDEYDGALSEVVDQIRTGRVMVYGGRFLFWMYPPSMFDAFNEVIILTYMFESHVISAYCKQNNFDVSYVWVNQSGTNYSFISTPRQYTVMQNVPSLIHFHDNPKMTRIGDDYYALSSSWFANRDNARRVDTLRKHIDNFFKNYCKAKSSELIWSVYAGSKSKVWGKGNIGGHLVFNSRATNEFRKRKYLAYCVNVFPNPNVMRFFKDHGIIIDRDLYALSIMIQWIWRSAIRDGEHVHIYLPSSRMRNILHNWLSTLSEVEK